jgi:hypothetical protein
MPIHAAAAAQRATDYILAREPVGTTFGTTFEAEIKPALALA